MVIAFTGHRPDKLGGWSAETQVKARYKVRLALHGELLFHIRQPTTAISGMALGVDQWAAELCVELGIPFTAAIPFEGQEKMWPRYQQRAYSQLLAKASKIHTVSPGKPFSRREAVAALQRRNEWMVDNCDLLLAYWNGTPGGTANCVRYAEGQEKPYVNCYKPGENNQ